MHGLRVPFGHALLCEAGAVGRRITIPLDGSSKDVKVENLMRDDASYTFAELPRINPSYKARPRRC